MANNEQFNPYSSSGKRSSVDLLPRFFRSNSNKKFLNATIDQLIQPGTVKKVNGFIGRQNSKSSTSTDIFLSAADKNRQDYQLEPAAVIKDYLGNTTFFKDYIDHINHIHVFGGDTSNHSRLNSQEFYSWNPHIDWDKFVNFQQYYWLPFGPDVIKIAGQQKDIISTFTIDVVDEEDNYAYLFTPNGMTRNPTLKLFRGQTYIFEVNATGHPFNIKRKRTDGTLDRYNTGVINNGVETGKIEFKVPKNAPDVLFYVSENSVDSGGVIHIFDIEENTFIDVEAEIIGKKTYTLPDLAGSPLSLSNGMKIEFRGEVSPAEYGSGAWYVEGVGAAIKLISEKDLEVRSNYTDQSTLYFDDLPFDQMPFSEYGNLPSRKDYLTINRSSPDNNAWSRYNRWFHKDVIEISAKVNFKQPNLTQQNRAIRPIIEFVPGIKLHNHGVKTKKPIEVIDNFTTDAFSLVEGGIGYNVDGIDLADGMRIIFNADPDPMVKNKVFRVNFITVNVSGKTLNFNAQTQVNVSESSIEFDTAHGLSTGNQITYLDRANVSLSGLQDRQVYWVKALSQFKITLFKDPMLRKPATIFATGTGMHSVESYLGRRKQIHLTEEPDAIPVEGESVPVRFGISDPILKSRLTGNQGQTYWFNGKDWQLSQVKFSTNQAPLFDVFDSSGSSFSDNSKYKSSNFGGTKLFSYKPGTGAVDKELGFALAYQNINNVGDIVFNFNLLIDQFEYKVGHEDTATKKIDDGYLKITQDLDRFKFENAWVTSAIKDYQPAVRVYKGTEQKNNFAIDIFSNISQLDDLRVKVYLNGKILKSAIDYNVETHAIYKYVVLNTDLDETDILTIKCFTHQPKNTKGYYEFPINLQNNPLNSNVETFTLGEVLNHVETIVENVDQFEGSFPGTGNLRDLGAVEQFGTRFVQHSAPLNLALYHLGNKDANIIKAINQSKDDYGKFKRSFLLEAEKHAFYGSVRDHTSFVLQKTSNNKHKANPYYLSDMFAYSAANVITYTVLDSRIKRYPLTVPFNLNTLSNKSVTIYLNTQQLVVNRDYLLGDDEFFELLIDIAEGDTIEAVEWETTDGSFCPATPTKLGLYPAFEPGMYIDRSYKPYIEKYAVPDVIPEVTTTFPLNYVNQIVAPEELVVIVNDNLAVAGVDYDVLRQNTVTSIKFKRPLERASTIEVHSPVVVIEGHDGSITVAFNDYRDHLLLELEKRIFNNLKIKYDPEIWNIFRYVPGHARATDYSRDEFNNIIANSLFDWIQLIGRDFTKNVSFDTLDSFTYNYDGAYLLNEKTIPKYWRGIYRWLFDTDRPDTCPWECLGFSIKPKWWESVYGPAPYTSNNFILWNDIKEGIIRNPDALLVRNPKVARPILEKGKPVNELGKLVSPLESGVLLGFPRLPETGGFTVGDGSPVESAWHKSSYYPFALLRACILMNPSDVLGRALDRSRITRNIANQLVYSETGLRLTLADLLVPSVASSSGERIYTSGLVNYVIDYLTSENHRKITQYKSDLKSLTNNLSTRLGAFTNKPKYKILLDSKTPSASGGVFIPEENYKVEFNVSSSIKRVSYSGVMITKVSSGFEVKGYDYTNQFFITYPFRANAQEVVVGGISESYLIWDSERTYTAGKIVRLNSSFYRVKVTHKTTTTFDPSLYTLLPDLPVIGGQAAYLRKDWDFNNPIVVPYNTVFSTIQEVVDFIQGYGEHLKQEGFVFDQFNNNLATLADWKTSIKEFLFWTTQNWTAGSVISLSPAADKLIFNHKMAVVDNVRDSFYDYSIYKVNGKKLEHENINIYRSGNYFELEPTNTTSGIYLAVLNLVQKEHVVIIDNATIFNDIVYDLEAGFRQERLKIIGYVTTEWSGGFEIPGFLFDQVKILDWEPWTDYNLGDTVRYKEFYYSAKSFIPGSAEFSFSDWHLIKEKLETKLLPNWDYRAEQFTDFYDLDTDNLDSRQQQLAQHLIGYQKRQYLENIINNDVSQYKFYQGMIAEKGTTNVLSKLFDTLSANDKESLTFNEEWAVRVGEYGAVDSFDELEIRLDEKEFRSNPQPLEIVDRINPELVDIVYRQRFGDLYIKPSASSSSDIFEISNVSNFLRSPGYVREQDVLISVDNLSNLVEARSVDSMRNAYIHTAFEGAEWNVYSLQYTGLKVLDVSPVLSNSTITFFCDRKVMFDKHSYIKIDSFSDIGINGFHQVQSVYNNTFEISTSSTLKPQQLKNIFVFSLNSFRISNIDDLNELIKTHKLSAESIIWADKNKNNRWSSYVNNPVYSGKSMSNQDAAANIQFGNAISLSQNGNICAIASTTDVILYEKGSTNNNWASFDRFTIDNLPSNFKSFGSVVKLSGDGTWLAIAAPEGYPTVARNLEQGFFYLYRRQPNGKYQPVSELSGTTIKEFTEHEVHYGSNIAFSKSETGHLMAVAAKDVVYVYSYDNNADLSDWQLICRLTSTRLNSGFGATLAFSEFDNVLVVGAPDYDDNAEFDSNGNRLNPGYGKVFVYRNQNNTYAIDAEISAESAPTDFSAFGSSLAISNNSNFIAIGAKFKDSDNKPDTGTVSIYKKENNTYNLHQHLYSIELEVNEQFGHAIGFMNDDETLVIASLNSNIVRPLTFDMHESKIEKFSYEIKPGITLTSMYVRNRNSSRTIQKTTFDKDTTRFNSIIAEAGRVDVYDKYNTKYIYGESLFNDSLLASGFGTSIEVGANTVLVAAPVSSNSFAYNLASDPSTGLQLVNAGKVFSYIKPANELSWKLRYEQLSDIDVNKIKKAYLYNITTNDLISYLDVVDVKQGKIPGIADQEIKFKLFYDPAIYSKSAVPSLNVDDGLSWESQHVGQLWWDLTRAKFVENNLGDMLYKSINWNSLYKTATIDIYEWVESKRTPAEWDQIADTEAGLAQGVSGTSKYGNEAYSIKSYFDPISRTVKNIYYFWVKNKKTVPQSVGRSLSADNVSKLIADPVGYGYPCIALNSSNSINLVNIARFLENKDVVLNIQQWLVDNQSNYHSEWKLISESDNVVIPSSIEQKWFHSLIGKDSFDRAVPDLNLPVKQRYGVEFNPRQGMFVNRIEPLKQLIDRVNCVLKDILVVDTYNLDDLSKFEEIPNEVNCLWDEVVDTENELRFISTVNFKSAKLQASTTDGRITSINIIDSGIGYARYRPYEVNINQVPIKWYGPDITIAGSGRGAKVKTVIDHVGSVVGFEIQNPGEGYDDNTNVSIRGLTALVKFDSSSLGRWSIYSWSQQLQQWQKTKVQSFDVRRYWQYLDWYKTGYDQYIVPDFLVESTYELLIADIPVGSIVKIKNTGSGGWSLIKKYQDNATIEYTENFELIGRQNGTIKFLEGIYLPSRAYDKTLLDTIEYDSYPVEELRIILKLLKNEILVKEYRNEYVGLFLDSIRYVLKEQLFADWVFKTSFVKAKHNVGNLTQRSTYKNDNLSDFENYITEVKPYRSKIREFISNYTTDELSKTSVNDFDLLPVIESSRKVTPISTRVDNKVIVSNASRLDTDIVLSTTSPWIDWYSNVGFEIVSIDIVDGGNGYISRPTVEIIGDQLDGGLPASAVAYITKGQVSRIDILHKGSRWISAPTIKFTGTLIEGGQHARAVAVIGNSVIRNNNTTIKFDRISKSYQYSALSETEVFSGAIVSGSKTQFPLRWSPNTDINKHTVILNGAEVLKNEYYLKTVTKKINGTTRYSGLLTFNQSPKLGSVITVHYSKNFDHLSAVDRINFFYNPTTGQLGKDLSQLMTGVDYGGVSISGIDFKNGWDAVSSMGEVWDETVPEFNDHTTTVTVDGQTDFRLPFVPKPGEQITVYVSKLDVNSASPSYLQYLDPVRIDSESYPLDAITNPDLVMKSFIGDGEQNVVVIPPSLRLSVYDVAESVVSGNSETIFYSDVIDGGASSLENADRFINGQYSNTPYNITVYGDRVIFRRASSDGSVMLRDDEYDTALSGGDLSYYTARGIDIDDVVIDGDEFVTPMTSHALEEVVPGQIMDTLAIKVYSRPVGGAPNIMFKSYFGDGVEKSFVIGQHFLNNNSIIVKVDDEIKQESVDYTINYESNLVEFISPPLDNRVVSIISISFSSATILDIDYFISDGETVEFITRAPWSSSLVATILVNGQPPEYELFTTNEEYVGTDFLWKSRVGIRLKTAPKKGAIINYIIDRGDVEQTASVAKSEVINLIKGQYEYELENPVGVSLPFEPNVLVKAGKRILRSPSYSYFTLAGNQLTFSLNDSKYQAVDVNASDLGVFLDGNLLELGKDYSVNLNVENTPLYGVTGFRLTGGSGLKEGDIVEIYGDAFKTAKFEVKVVTPTGSILAADLVDAGEYRTIPKAPYVVLDSSGSKFSTISATLDFVTIRDLPAISVELRNTHYKEGAKLVVEISKNAEYQFISSNIIQLNSLDFDVDKIEILSFFNHTVLHIERTEEILNQEVNLDAASLEYVDYSNKFKGRFTLRNPVPSGDFVWVVRNGVLLSLHTDYTLESNMKTVRLFNYPDVDDVIEIIAFTNTVVSDSFAYMQFKDITNRTVYKRLNGAKATVLEKDLTPYAREIVVKDASVLDIPNSMKNRPGVIEIFGERIEYFKLEGNVLRQLRRSTLGTGAADCYPAGTLVQNIGPSETIPYKDSQELFVNTVSGPATKEIALPFLTSKDDIEVFVGGFRLKKNAYTLYKDSSHPNSPEGDIVLPPEFEVFNDISKSPQKTTSIIRFASALNPGLKVVVARRQGKVWNDLGKRLANSNNSISKFIGAVNETWLR